MKEEIEAYINKAMQDEMDEDMSEVYVTNHEPKQKKFTTIKKSEDEEFFKYKQALA